MDMLLKIIVIAGVVVALAGAVYHHVHACEGGDVYSGKVVVGDSVEEVLEKLAQKEV